MSYKAPAAALQRPESSSYHCSAGDPENRGMLAPRQHRGDAGCARQEEAAYKLCKVKRQEFGRGGVPYIVTHDGRTIRYPDPEIKVCTL